MKKRLILTAIMLLIVTLSMTILVACGNGKPSETTGGSDAATTTLGSAQVTTAGPVFDLTTEEIDTYDNHLLTGGDPFVMRYDGKYYLYCSTGNDSPIYVQVSTDLVNWSEKIICATASEVPAGTNEHGGVCNVALPAYAPEVTYFNGKFYMVTSLGGTGHHTFVAESPEGPFELMTGNWGNTIDGHIFIDNDGKWYFYRANGGNILAYEMPTPLQPSSNAIQTGATIGGGWTEGPMVVYHDGFYYFTYTGNLVSNPAYRIYYATSKGSCTKFSASTENPVLISTTSSVSGIGHSSSVKAPDLDSYYMVYHSKDYKNTRVVNIGRIVFNGNRMYVLGPTTEDAQTSLMPEIYAQFDDAADLSLFTGNVSVKKGSMIVAADQTVFANKALGSDKYTIEVCFNSIEASSAGVVFGYKDDNNYGSAAFDTAKEELVVTFVVNGEKSETRHKLVRSFDMAYDFKATQAIQVEKKGNEFTFYVNDRELCEVESDLAGGEKVGVTTKGGSAGVGYFGATAEVGGSSNDAHYKPVTSQTGYIQANHCLEENIETKLDSTTRGIKVIARKGETFNYRILVERDGKHNLSAYLDTDDGATLDIYCDGKYMGSITPSTERSDYTEVLADLELTAGQHVLTVFVKDGECSIMYYKLLRTAELTQMKKTYDNSGDRFEYKDGVCWSIKNGVMNADGWGKRLYGEYNNSNYTIAVDMTPKDLSSGIGLLVRVQNPAETNLLSGMNAGKPVTSTDENSAKGGTDWLQGYYIMFNSTKIQIVKQNYNSKSVSNAKLKLAEDKTYHIEVECVYDTIRVYVDGEMVLEYVDDTPFHYGMFGYKASGGAAIFDNFAVTREKK